MQLSPSSPRTSRLDSVSAQTSAPPVLSADTRRSHIWPERCWRLASAQAGGAGKQQVTSSYLTNTPPPTPPPTQVLLFVCILFFLCSFLPLHKNLSSIAASCSAPDLLNSNAGGSEEEPWVEPRLEAAAETCGDPPLPGRGARCVNQLRVNRPLATSDLHV